MKRYLQLLILPVIAFGFMACMKADKSEKVIAAAETTMQQQELSLNDTLTKVVKRKPGKALTEKQYYILRKQGTERPFKMNLMTTIKRVIILCSLQVAFV
jgi:peptide-methionine (R)-S-oxide reductase